MKFEKFLVPLDGSALAEAALWTAVNLARRTAGSSLALVRAAEASSLPGDVVAAQVEVVKEAEEYLDRLADDLRARGVTAVTTSVWYGPPASAIVEAAAVAKADVIVMSTHGRSGLGRLLMGSVAESVMRATHTPILLLRPAGAPTATLAAERDAEVNRV